MSDINILQTYFKQEQKASLEPEFNPFNIENNPAHHLRELPLYYQLYQEGRHAEHEYTGIVSYKFRLKSKFSGQMFLKFIEDNPGYDAYFINPYPQLAYLSYNAWEQGEYFHPGICELASDLLDKSSYDISLSEHGRDTNEHLLYTNIWVGNTRFWDRYLPFLLELHEISGVTDNSKDNHYLSNTPYITPTVIYPFIFERLFTTFIKHQSDLSFMAYQHTHEEIISRCISPAERIMYQNMREIVDKWDDDKSYDNGCRNTFKALLGAYAEYEFLMRDTENHPFG